MPLGIPHSAFLSWSEDDQDAALAFMRAKTELCSCGTRAAEWEADRFAYTGTIWRCPGCELLELERQNIPENAKGMHVGLERNLHQDEDDEVT